MGETKLRLLRADVKTDTADMHSMGGLRQRVVTSRYLTLECEAPTGANKMSPELVDAMARGEVEIVVRKLTPDADRFKTPPMSVSKDLPASQEPAW